MSKIIYYIGAGASCGRKEAREIINEGKENEHLIVHEGLPVVNEITNSLHTFKMDVQNVPIENERLYTINKNKIWAKYQIKGSELNQERMNLIRDIDGVAKAAKEHATIDTYAKKLFLTERESEFKRLKNVLSAFFVWAQMIGNPDQRYDTFFANILQLNDLNIPQNISVISWNYDSQFEIAYRNYNNKEPLPIYEKKESGNILTLNKSGRIFKVNGSANFGDFNIFDLIQDNDTVNQMIQLIEYYGNTTKDTSGIGSQFYSHLSFAWEISDKQNQLMNAINQTTVDTESVVVIGYSFPFFNREIDRVIFAGMPNLKTIYIQDPNPDAVEQSLRAVIPIGYKVNIEHQKDCTQFYLPREL